MHRALGAMTSDIDADLRHHCNGAGMDPRSGRAGARRSLPAIPPERPGNPSAICDREELWVQTKRIFFLSICVLFSSPIERVSSRCQRITSIPSSATSGSYLLKAAQYLSSLCVRISRLMEFGPVGHQRSVIDMILHLLFEEIAFADEEIRTICDCTQGRRPLGGPGIGNDSSRTFDAQRVGGSAASGLPERERR